MKLILRSKDIQQDLCDAFYCEGAEILKSHFNSSLAEISAAYPETPAILLLPGQECVLTTVVLPAKNLTQARKAVPFALEDELSEDIDKLHFAILNKDKNPDYPVLVIAKNSLRQWQTRMDQNNIDATKITSEILCLPLQQNTWTVVIEENSALIRMGRYQGFSCDLENLELALTSALQDPSYNNPEKIMLLTSEQSDVLNAFDTIPIERERNTIPVSKLLAEEYLANHGTINLLQGEFRHVKKQKHSTPIWPIALGLLATWMMIILLKNIVGFFYLHHQDNLVQQQIATLYRQVFPDAEVIESPELRIQQKLTELKNAGGDDGFLTLLAKTGKVLQEHPDIKLQNLAYQNQGLSFQVNTSNLQMLQSFGDALDGTGFVVHQTDAHVVSNAVAAEFTVEKGAS